MKLDKQGREVGLASQHEVMSAFRLSGHLFSLGRSPWHTAFMNAVHGGHTVCCREKSKKRKEVGLFVKMKEKDKPKGVSKTSVLS